MTLMNSCLTSETTLSISLMLSPKIRTSTPRLRSLVIIDHEYQLLAQSAEGSRRPLSPGMSVRYIDVIGNAELCVGTRPLPILCSTSMSLPSREKKRETICIPTPSDFPLVVPMKAGFVIDNTPCLFTPPNRSVGWNVML